MFFFNVLQKDKFVGDEIGVLAGIISKQSVEGVAACCLPTTNSSVLDILLFLIDALNMSPF